jgi:D-alanyl-D-alanine carboxypeptidase (penicillin-binding protein 5/6)
MVTAVALLTGLWTIGPLPANAADPTPAPLTTPTVQPTPAPLGDLAPGSGADAPPDVVTDVVIATDTLGGARLAESGTVVDTSRGAADLPQVKARTWVLADATTGEVLAAKKAHKKRSPASTLKTLTALTLLPRLEPDQVWVGTAKAQNTYGSKVGIRAGREYTVDELFYGLMLPSGNDAAIALAQANASVKRTVEQMNDVAEQLQAINTTAVNTSGLDAPGQVSTAYDLALIARAALEREDFRRYAATKSAEFPNPRKKRKKPITIYNQNDLIMDGYKGAIGVKTGYTSRAGRTFIGAATRDGRTLIVTLMGIREPSDEAAAKLLSWGFKNHDRIVPVGELVGPISDQQTAATVALPAAPSGDVASTTQPDVALVAAPQQQSFASLSPSAWGWLAVFAAAIILLSVAMVRRVFKRRRRSFVG